MALEFRCDFEAANAVLTATDADHIHFKAESRRGELILWWMFEIGGACGRNLTITMDNAADVMGGLNSLQAARPVVSLEDGRWYYWHSLPPGQIDEAAGTWSFRLQMPREADRARIAFCFPYTYSTVLRAVEGWKRAGLVADQLCTSERGRAVPILFAGAGPDAKDRQMVVIIARQHAGETPGSFVLEGIVELFLARGLVGSWLRERGLAVIVPAVDVDNIAEGSFGKNEPPVDYNRDWAGESMRPQIRELRRLISDLASRNRYLLLLDLHAPCAHEPNMVYRVPEDQIGPNGYRLQNQFAEILEKVQSAWYDFSAQDSRDGGDDLKTSAVCAQHREHGCAAVCLETAYFRTAGGRPAFPLRWRQHGQAVATAIRLMVEKLAGA